MNKQKRRILFGLVTLFTLAGCNSFIEKIDDGPTVIVEKEGKPLSIVFSHNINGETHPCGCRHHPLGGLPQVAGQIAKLKETSNVIYVDSGDLFFPSSVLPKSIIKSKTFAARNLAKGLSQIGLKYVTPGDQDFALGFDFLKEMAKENKFEFLVANLRDESFPHKKWVKIKNGALTVYLTGFVEPKVLENEIMGHFLPASTALAAVFSEMKKDGLKENDPTTRLIVVSHAGIEYDEAMAKQFPQIDWMIGAHSQSFLREPNVVGKTKMGQVLSRNHYLGEIRLEVDPKKDGYEIHEMRDEVAKLLADNPYYGFIDSHKEKLQSLQIEEQNEQFAGATTVRKFEPANSCLDCHSDQHKFWQETPHSVAFATLIKANEHFNTDCIKCHSVGLFDPRGYSKASEIVDFNDIGPDQVEAHRKAYWAEINKAFKNTGSIRDMKKDELKKLSVTWQETDKKYGVAHNFANVQCMNCHDVHSEHPFSSNPVKLTDKQRAEKIKSSCLNCHDPDQSPEWYDKDEKGLARKLNEERFQVHYKKVSCPTYSE